MQHLAQPAPKVEAASGIERAPDVEDAKTETARAVGAATVDRATAVEPATFFDPKKHAPTPKPLVQEKGISVEALRGTKGADFESTVAVLRGAPQKNFLKKALPLFFDERDFVAFGEVKRYVVVKGDCCFVFTEKTAMSPLFAIPLDEVYPILEDRANPDKFSVTISPTSVHATKDSMVTVLFKYRENDKQGYQFTFDTTDDKSVAKRFYDVIDTASAKSKAVTGSILKAKNAGKIAAKTQPGIWEKYRERDPNCIQRTFNVCRCSL